MDRWLSQLPRTVPSGRVVTRGDAPGAMGKRARGDAPAIIKKRTTGKQPEEGAGVPQEAGAPGGPQERSRTVEFIDEHIMPYIGDALASMRPEHSVARGG
eukprot:6568496-Lingulodinium_polyedra.AAC.1